MHHGVATGGIWSDTYSVQLQKILSYNLYYKIIFSIGSFIVKIKKRKMLFWTPKRLCHTKLMKKHCSTPKVCLIKVSSEYRKNAKGEKLEPP